MYCMQMAMFELFEIRSTLILGHAPITVGSRSTKIALGTCFPDPVSLKNVLKESSP